MLPIKNKSEKGFTIVEAVVSVLILSIAITGAMQILVKNSNDANAIKDSFIASGLAQEGIEIVRNFRDNEWSIPGALWGSIVQNGTWSVQWDSALLGGNNNVVLKKDASGFYNYAAGLNTPFKRSIVISSPNPGIEKKITVTVSWTERSDPKSLIVEDHLYNWK